MVCSEPRALQPFSRNFPARSGNAHGPGRVQTKRGRPRSLGERADDGQYTEFAGRNAQWFNDLTGVEASQRMRQTCAADKDAGRRSMQARLCDQVQVVFSLRVADSDSIGFVS